MNQKVTAGNWGDRIRSDCQVSLELRDSGGIKVVLRSKVEALFGRQIKKQVTEILEAFEIRDAFVELDDSGALPFVIGARLEAAVKMLRTTDLSWLPDQLPGNLDQSKGDQFRFSRLYLPGNTPSMMLNAGIHRPNGVILDLEDSVAPNKKQEARLLVRNALRQVDFYGAERMVRINQLPAGLEDLDYIVPHHVQLILIPKCEHGSQVHQVEERVSKILQLHHLEKTIYFMPIIESALGIENAFEIAVSSAHVVAMAIGLEDYTADIGVERTRDGAESHYARTRLVNACKAAGIQPIDSVYSDVADMHGLMENVKKSKSLGFEGMGCIHPRQIPIIHQGFCPTESEISKARKILAAFEEAESKGLGVIALGNKMIDPPVVKRAQRTIELATQFGLKEQPDS